MVCSLFRCSLAAFVSDSESARGLRCEHGLEELLQSADKDYDEEEEESNEEAAAESNSEEKKSLFCLFDREAGSKSACRQWKRRTKTNLGAAVAAGVLSRGGWEPTRHDRRKANAHTEKREGRK